jgi:hypothetical protein
MCPNLFTSIKYYSYYTPTIHHSRSHVHHYATTSHLLGTLTNSTHFTLTPHGFYVIICSKYDCHIVITVQSLWTLQTDLACTAPPPRPPPTTTSYLQLQITFYQLQQYSYTTSLCNCPENPTNSSHIHHHHAAHHAPTSTFTPHTTIKSHPIHILTTPEHYYIIILLFECLISTFHLPFSHLTLTLTPNIPPHFSPHNRFYML